MKILHTLDQLKALSDPLRTEIMVQLIKKAYTGQQLAEHFNLSRAKVHYHLKELEKNELIEIVKTEEKNGIIQKFYRSVASGFTPSADLLPYTEDVRTTSKQLVFQMLENTKRQLIAAPKDALSPSANTGDPNDSPFLASMLEVTVQEKDFQLWLEKYYELMNELHAISKNSSSSNEKIYHISSFGFQVTEKLFDDEQ